MANLLGNNLVVRLGNLISSPVILCATSCTLNLNQNTIEATCKGDGTGTDKWSSAIAGSANWDISTDNLYNPDNTLESFDALAKIIIDDANGVADNEVDLVFEISNADAVSGTDVSFYSGKAILTDVSLNGPVDEFATYTANFKGTGALAITLTPA
jgi:predicted secreted protein